MVKVVVKVLVKKCDAFSRTTFFCIKRQEFFSTKKVLHSMHFSMHFFDAFLDLGTIFSMKLVFFFVVCFRSLEKSIRPRLQTPSERKPDMVYDSFSVLKRPIPFFGRNWRNYIQKRFGFWRGESTQKDEPLVRRAGFLRSAHWMIFRPNKDPGFRLLLVAEKSKTGVMIGFNGFYFAFWSQSFKILYIFLANFVLIHPSKKPVRFCI